MRLDGAPRGLTKSRSPINNDCATSNPTVTDDVLRGYDTGSTWYNLTNSSAWVCIKGTAGAAVWQLAAYDSGWHYVGAAGEPAFQNSWVNYGSWGDAAFRRVNNEVYLAGLIKSGGTTAVIFTLPVGYRLATQTGMSAGLVFITIANGAIGRIDVTPAGNVQANSLSNLWVSLNMIRFITGDSVP